MSNNNNINILIIDDKEDNILVLQDLLSDEFGLNKKCLFPLKGEQEEFRQNIRKFVSEGSKAQLNNYLINYIFKYDIDLLILDFALSIDEENDKLINTSGYNFLDTLNEHENKLLKEIPIIVFSVMEQEQMQGKNYARPVAKLPKQFVDQNNIIDTLQQDLKNNNSSIFYSILFHGGIYKEKKNKEYDLAILCALKEEFDEVLKLPNKWKNKESEDNEIDTFGWKQIFIDNENYLTTIFEDKDGKDIKVVAKCMYDMGMVESASFTTRMLNLFKPKYFTMTGIAAGIRDDDIRLGDILIPEYSWNWQFGKLKTVYQKVYDDKSKRYKKEVQNHFDKETKQRKLAGYLSSVINEKLSRDESFVKKLIQDFNSDNMDAPITVKSDRIPKIISKKMVSGSAVVASSAVIEEIKSRKLVGLDMEAYGVFYAVEKAQEYSNTKAIVIKSICDFADEEKEDSYHHFASYASAQTMHRLFTKHVEF